MLGVISARSLAIIVFFFALDLSARQHGKNRFCLALSDLLQRFDPVLIDGKPLLSEARESTWWGKKKSYRVIGSVAGDHGGKLRVLERGPDAEFWMQESKGLDDEFRGDPRWVIHVLGEDAAARLGIRQISNRHILIPDATEVQGAVDAFNRTAAPEDQIAVSFYEPKRKNHVPSYEYAREFVVNGRLPIAKSGRESVHDINYHMLGVLLPPEALNQLRKQMSVIFDFRVYLAQRKLLAKKMNRHWKIGDWIDQHIDGIAVEVDNITNGPVMALNPNVPASLSGVNRYRDVFDFWILGHFDLEKSPEQYLVNSIPISHRDCSPELKKVWSEFLQEKEATDLDFKKPLDWSKERVREETIRRLNVIKRGSALSR
ncbi:MAG: hypothetical protein AB1540_04110 [Bdellovibrionota bacterium]